MRDKRGFTFVELLAAIAFLAILIPTAIHALTISHRAGVVAERKVVAAQLADSKLTEMVLTDEWRKSSKEGTFGEEQPGYRWRLEDANWENASVRKLTVAVFFSVQGSEYSVPLTTLVSASETTPTPVAQ